MTLPEMNYEARADYFLDSLKRGSPIPWYGTQCNMHDMWEGWLNERAELKTGIVLDDLTLQDVLRKDCRDDWGEYRWKWCIEAAQVEKRPETYRHVQERL